MQKTDMSKLIQNFHRYELKNVQDTDRSKLKHESTHIKYLGLFLRKRDVHKIKNVIENKMCIGLYYFKKLPFFNN